MSERSLVVHQDDLTRTEETPSRAVQRDHERRLREGLVRLTEVLDSVRAAVTSYGEDARETEVENVAIVG